MKTTRRILAVLLAVMMIAAMMVPASAADPMKDGGGNVLTGTITIENAMAGTTYKLYRVFDLSESNGAALNAYITNTEWNTAIRGSNFDPTYVHTVDAGVGASVTPTGLGDEAAAITFAGLVVNAGVTENANSGAISSSGSYSFSNMQYGYYVMQSSRGGAGTKYTVFTLNKDSITIREKNEELPNISKAVSNTGVTGTYHAGVSSDIDKTVYYQITVKVAAGTDAYTITDTADAGITIDGGTLKVYKGSVGVGNELTATECTAGVSGQVVTVTLADTYRKTLADNDAIIITYEAKLNDNAVAGVAGNKNEAQLQYGASYTTPANATVFTGSLSFAKYITGTSTRLAGAEFVLKNGTQFAKLDGTYPDFTFNSWVATEAEATKITTTAADNNISIKGLDAGTYTLVETVAPTGYVPVADKTITINRTMDTPDTESVKEIDDNQHVDVYNTPGTKLPETGGIGTTIFYVVGVVLILGAVTVLAVKRRKSAQ